MSTAIGDLEDATPAIKDGLEHVGKEPGHQPEQPAPDTEPTTVTPADCGPMACEGDDK